MNLLALVPHVSNSQPASPAPMTPVAWVMVLMACLCITFFMTAIFLQADRPKTASKLLTYAVGLAIALIVLTRLGL